MLAAPPVLAGTRLVSVRWINMTNSVTEESIRSVYWYDGEYVTEAMHAIDYFMRDWRTDQTRPISRRTIDILAAVHNSLDTGESFDLISGFRSPATNRRLSRTRDGVVSNSLHIKGMAADIRLKGRSTTTIAKAAKRCNAGGVGTYSRSGFVHVDCGRVRSWGS